MTDKQPDRRTLDLEGRALYQASREARRNYNAEVRNYNAEVAASGGPDHEARLKKATALDDAAGSAYDDWRRRWAEFEYLAQTQGVPNVPPDFAALVKLVRDVQIQGEDALILALEAQPGFASAEFDAKGRIASLTVNTPRTGERVLTRSTDGNLTRLASKPFGS